MDTPTVIKIVKSLKNTNSYGIDEIPCKYIKDAIEVVAPYITVIVNTSIVISEVPEQ